MTPSLDKPIELKACPFCGEGANLDCIEQQVFVGCADLECLGGWVNKPHLTNAEAIAAWNTRAEASQLAGVVGERERLAALTTWANELEAGTSPRAVAAAMRRSAALSNNPGGSDG